MNEVWWIWLVPPYVINWSVLQIRGNLAFVMAAPFRTYVQESQDYCGEAASLFGPSNKNLSKEE